MKKTFLFNVLIFILHASFAQSSDSEKNLQKYWKYRERLKNFVVVGDCQGCSIPSAIRGYAADKNTTLTEPWEGDADNVPGGSEDGGELEYGDATMLWGHYLAFLATEYAMMKKNGVAAHLYETKREIYYALEALNRLDKKAEYWWRYYYKEDGTSANEFATDLNGFFIRDDINPNPDHIGGVGFGNTIVNSDLVENQLNSSLFPPQDGHKANYYWGNTPLCADGAGNFLISDIINHHDDSYTTPTTIVGDKVIIKEAKILKKYNIDWFDTRSTSTTPYSSGTKWSNLIGRLKPYYPGTEPDLAFQAYLRGTSFRNNETPPPIDTLLCGEDTISVDGIFDDDVNGLYSYFWDFGNGQTSNLVHPTVIYQPGTYNASLIVTDTIGNSDTLSQIIYVPNCDSINNRKFNPLETNPSYSDNIDNLYIDPNPNNGEFILTLKLKSQENYTLEIIDARGKIIYATVSSQSKINMNLSDKNNGLYILKLSNKNGILYKKLIKQ